MKNAPHHWILVSLVHPVLSTLCVILGTTISGWLGYATALLAFLANLPGVMVIKHFHRYTPSESTATKCLVYFSMIGITWLFVVVPACYLTSHFLSNRARR